MIHRLLIALACAAAVVPAWSQAPGRRMMIATDPVAYGRPQGGAQYVAEIRKVTSAPIRWEPAEKELQIAKYQSWPNYANNLQFVVRRYCGLWGRGT